MMDVLEIRRYLPHRYPFLFIDRVVNVDVDKKEIQAYKNISINEEVFLGHFPEHPIFPGVLIIEAMAQASGILGFKIMDVHPEDGSLYYFVGMEKLRLRKPVVPGDRLDLESKVMNVKRNLWRFACTASVGDEEICQVEILCAEQRVK